MYIQFTSSVFEVGLNKKLYKIYVTNCALSKISITFTVALNLQLSLKISVYQCSMMRCTQMWDAPRCKNSCINTNVQTVFLTTMSWWCRLCFTYHLKELFSFRPFANSCLLDRMAAFLNFFYVHLLGPKRKQLKVCRGVLGTLWNIYSGSFFRNS